MGRLLQFLSQESTLRVELGTFARWSIETRLGSNVRVGVLAALHHYTRRLRSGKGPVSPLPGHAETREGPATSFELQVGSGMRAELERQARRHHVSLNRLLTHAIYVYLADLDAADTPRGAGVASRACESEVRQRPAQGRKFGRSSG